MSRATMTRGSACPEFTPRKERISNVQDNLVLGFCDGWTDDFSAWTGAKENELRWATYCSLNHFVIIFPAVFYASIKQNGFCKMVIFLKILNDLYIVPVNDVDAMARFEKHLDHLIGPIIYIKVINVRETRLKKLIEMVCRVRYAGYRGGKIRAAISRFYDIALQAIKWLSVDAQTSIPVVMLAIKGHEWFCGVSV